MHGNAVCKQRSSGIDVEEMLMLLHDDANAKHAVLSGDDSPQLVCDACHRNLKGAASPWLMLQTC